MPARCSGISWQMIEIVEEIKGQRPNLFLEYKGSTGKAEGRSPEISH